MKFCTLTSFLLSREAEVVTRPLLSQVPQFQKKVNKSLEVIFPICCFSVCLFLKNECPPLYEAFFFFLSQHRRLLVSTFNFTPTVPVPQAYNNNKKEPRDLDRHGCPEPLTRGKIFWICEVEKNRKIQNLYGTQLPSTSPVSSQEASRGPMPIPLVRKRLFWSCLSLPFPNR